jgi:probable DNA metabolism protein
MPKILLHGAADFPGWRAAARSCLARDIPPAEIVWQTDPDAADLFDVAPKTPTVTSEPATPFAVPRAFLELAGQAALHREPERFTLLYRLLWRLRSERRLMEFASDPDVARLGSLARAVRRDIHKMHAFVRFRAVATEAGERFVAWYEPDNHIVEAAAPFFMRRFANLVWTIVTPERAAHWPGSMPEGGANLVFGPGAPAGVKTGDDGIEALWCEYYANIFNPARLNPAMMRAEMPTRFWKNLPETALIEPLTRDAAPRTRAMIGKAAGMAVARRGAEIPAAPVPPVAGGWEGLREAARACRACDLWRPATQTVFGEGPLGARIMLVGEQPGDSEDLAGKPFVGPAGQLLNRALAAAGIDRAETYVTNAVKHFKFAPRGKRRLHQKPNMLEIHACAGWLEQELALVNPAIVVALGATAAQAVFGRAMAIGVNRGKIRTFGERLALITIHPSFLLRLPDEEAKRREYGAFVADLALARK